MPAIKDYSLGLLMALIAVPGWAGVPSAADATLLPHVGQEARETWLGAFLPGAGHRAFVVAPGGAWGWSAEQPNADTALAVALEGCSRHSEIPCVPYAVDQRVVFDAVAWSTLWGPYKTRAEAARAPVGKKRGMRFPNLAFADAGGKALSISALRGKVAVVHFWGSWCNPCKRELPDLQKLVAKLKGQSPITFVFYPVRESAADARRWLAAQKLDLAVSDGGLKGAEDDQLKLADGGRMRDRDLAMVFPTTYVLDKHGIVVFSHAGPLENWVDYAPFLLDAASRSGR